MAPGLLFDFFDCNSSSDLKLLNNSEGVICHSEKFENKSISYLLENMISGDRDIDKTGDFIWISDEVSEKLKVSTGDTLTYEISEQDLFTFEVAGVYKANKDISSSFIAETTYDKLRNSTSYSDEDKFDLLIKCNDFYCVNMVNIGFDCAVVKEAAKLKKLKFVTPGISYILGVVVVLFKKFGTKMKIIFDDGEVLDREFTLTAIGNGKFCGGGFCAAPRALLRDGLFDVCAIDKVSRLTFIKLVSSYKKGTYLENKKAMRIIRHRQVPHFRMEFESPLPICIDGEIKGAKNVDFSVARNAFNFVIPKGSEYKYEENAN